MTSNEISSVFETPEYDIRESLPPAAPRDVPTPDDFTEALRALSGGPLPAIVTFCIAMPLI